MKQLKKTSNYDYLKLLFITCEAKKMFTSKEKMLTSDEPIGFVLLTYLIQKI